MLKIQAPEVPEIAVAARHPSSARDQYQAEAHSELKARDWTELLLAVAAFMLLMPVLKAAEAISRIKRATSGSIRR